MVQYCIILVLIFLHSLFALSTDHQAWSYDKVIYEVNVRQYSEQGTFAAFAEHLPRLQEMGVGILWFMPIHPIGEQNRLGSLGSYYAVQNYFDVNPEYGNLQDFKSLVDEAHALGMYVIIDWVANHTAWDHVLTTTHPEWYTKNTDGGFMPPDGTNWTDVIDLDFSQSGLRQYMIDAMSFWIENTDIDGFRCDAVSWVPLDFWQTAISELKSIKSKIIMLAEDDGTQYQNVGFDISYAWNYHGFGSGILKRIIDGSADATDLATYLQSEQIRFSNDHYRMYFTSNHDENSWYGTVFEQFGDAAESFNMLTCLLDGIPMIYSGQEAGLSKRLAFFDKDLIEWKAHAFADRYTELFLMKKENQALWNGENGGNIQIVDVKQDDDVLAFMRNKNGDRVLGLFNLTATQQTVTITDASASGQYTDVFTDNKIGISESFQVELAPWEYKIYTQKNSDKVDSHHVPLNDFQLGRNYPNPFNPATTIRYALPQSGHVVLKVFDTTGRLVDTLVDEIQQSGEHFVKFQPTSLASGAYLCTLKFGQFVQSRKMLLIR